MLILIGMSLTIIFFFFENLIFFIYRFRKLLPCTTPIQVERKASVQISTSPIWCLDYLDNLLCIGCADGRLEFWEGITGKFKVINTNY